MKVFAERALPIDMKDENVQFDFFQRVNMFVKESKVNEVGQNTYLTMLEMLKKRMGIEQLAGIVTVEEDMRVYMIVFEEEADGKYYELKYDEEKERHYIEKNEKGTKS